MTYWINRIKLSGKKEKLIYLCLLLFQLFRMFFYFSGEVQNITWNEKLYSFLLILPWILPIVLYLNFQMLPISDLLYCIRCTSSKRWKTTLRIIIINIIFASIIPYGIGLVKFFICHSITNTLYIMLELIFRWRLFLFNISLLQCILMLLWKNKGIITALLFFVLLMTAYTRSTIVATFVFSPLFPANLNIVSVLIGLGYTCILMAIYIHLEEKRELL